MPAVCWYSIRRTSHHLWESGRSPSAPPCEPGRCKKESCSPFRSRGWRRTEQDAGQTAPSTKQEKTTISEIQELKRWIKHITFTASASLWDEQVLSEADRDETGAYCCLGREEEGVLVDTRHIGGALHDESDPGNGQTDVSAGARCLFTFFTALPRHLPARDGTSTCFELWRRSSSSFKMKSLTLAVVVYRHLLMWNPYCLLWGSGAEQGCCSFSPDL